VAKVRLDYWRGVQIFGFPIIGGYPPPLQRNYSSYLLYRIAYLAWRAATLNQMFSYIPFSSTEDRMGEIRIQNYTIQPPSSENIVILNSEIRDQQPADLFFPHMQENFELADLFQTIYTPKGIDRNAPPDAKTIAPSIQPYCDIREVRINPGDQLFAGTLRATVAYTAQVSCIFTRPEPQAGILCQKVGGDCLTGPSYNYDCDIYYRTVDCPVDQFCGVGCSNLRLPSNTLCDEFNSGYSCYPRNWDCSQIINQESDETVCPNKYVCAVDGTCRPPTSTFNFTETCNVSVPISFQTITKTPLADEIWSKLVAGPASVFKRVFPKIEDVEGRPIRRLWDIPAATGAVFRSLTPGLRVVAGNPTYQVPGANASIYFPHIGALHEYFLNCIQKTLKPRGFGSGCLSAPESSVNFICPYSSIPSMSTNSNCTLSFNQLSAAKIPPLMKKVFEAAGAQHNVPPDLIAAVMYSEGGFEERTINDSCYGEGFGGSQEYTDETIENAILCQFPNCNPETEGAGSVCNYDTTQGPGSCIGGGTHYGPYQQCPNGFNPCNFYDATMHMANQLARGRYGDPSYAGESCLGSTFNTGAIEGSLSCQKSAWTCKDILTAIRAETGSCIEWHFCDILNVYGSCNSEC